MTTVIETDEAGRLELPLELMSAIKPQTKYVVEAKGDGLETMAHRSGAGKPVLAQRRVGCRCYLGDAPLMLTVDANVFISAASEEQMRFMWLWHRSLARL